MTKKELLARLDRLNVIIDRRIMQGKPYADFAREHTAIRRLLGLTR